MDDRIVYAMGGMLAALVVGGMVVDRLAAPQGTTGDLHDVLPAARARAHAWKAGAALVDVAGRDIVDGRNGDRGAWEFVFADPERPGRFARVVVGSHLLALRELPDGSGVASGGPFSDDQFADTETLARRLKAYGLRSRTPATFSVEISDGELPTLRITTTGRLAATWWLDARSGELLDYRTGRDVQ